MNVHGFVGNSPTFSVDPRGELLYTGPYAAIHGYPYDESVAKCQIGIFYGHYWSDDSHPGMQRLRVDISSSCARAAFIGCATATQITSPAPLEDFTPPSGPISWFPFLGGENAKGFVDNAKASAIKQAKKFIASCCCDNVRIFVKGIALKKASFLTPSDPDWGETIIISSPQ